MTDREMLEAAAKAAGIVIVRSRLDDPLQRDMLVKNSRRNTGQESGAWNPLTDDGDALRLAVKLHMRLDLYTGVGAQCGPHPWMNQADYKDKDAATRRAIVRAAAEIGRAK